MPGTPIRRIPRDELPADYQAAWDLMYRLTGDATSAEVLSHSRPCRDWYSNEFYGQIFYNQRPGMKVDVRTKHLLRTRFSKQHGCALCNRGNEEQSRAAGYSDAQLDALLDAKPNPALFSEAELAVIEFADQMLLHNMEGRLTKALYDRLRAHFSDEQIVEMAMVSAVLVGAAKMMFVLDVVPREANCPFGATEGPLATAAE